MICVTKRNNERGYHGGIKGLIIAIGAIVGWYILGYLAGMDTFAGSMGYVPPIALIIAGLWMVTNKIDIDTPWGFGFLASGAIYLGVMYGVL